eukprot:2822812-Rhodomonas_salina.2
MPATAGDEGTMPLMGDFRKIAFVTEQSSKAGVEDWARGGSPAPSMTSIDELFAAFEVQAPCAAGNTARRGQSPRHWACVAGAAVASEAWLEGDPCQSPTSGATRKRKGLYLESSASASASASSDSDSGDDSNHPRNADWEARERCRGFFGALGATGDDDDELDADDGASDCEGDCE